MDGPGAAVDDAKGERGCRVACLERSRQCLDTKAMGARAAMGLSGGRRSDEGVSLMVIL